MLIDELDTDKMLVSDGPPCCISSHLEKDKERPNHMIGYTSCSGASVIFKDKLNHAYVIANAFTKEIAERILRGLQLIEIMEAQ